MPKKKVEKTESYYPTSDGTNWEEARDAAGSSTFYGLKLDEWQEKFKSQILDPHNLLVICNAAAGTGKTVISAGCANILVAQRKYEGIVYITAPVQEENMGYLPGTVEEKTDIYSEPFVIALEKIGVNPYTAIKKNDTDGKFYSAYIECRPHNYLRGITFDNKVIIIDESQNYHFSELKKVLTRCSDTCKVIMIGHTGQCDLPSKDKSGFHRYLEAADGFEYAAKCELVNNYRGKLSNWADSVIK